MTQSGIKKSLKKEQIAKKYDLEAQSHNCDEWMRSGNSVRVPESRVSHYFIDRKIDEALKLIDSGIDRSSRVLEIGCSFGHMTSILARKFDNLTAVDISRASIKLAEKRLALYGINNVNFLVDDAEELNNLNDRSFDVVFSFSTIRYCPDPEKALNAIRSKVKPGGLVIIDFPNAYSPWHLLIKKVLVGKHIHDNLYTENKLKRLFKNCGFRDVKTKVFLFTTKRLPVFSLPLFKLLDKVLESIPFVKKLGGIIIVKARVK